MLGWASQSGGDVPLKIHRAVENAHDLKDGSIDSKQDDMLSRRGQLASGKTPVG